MIRLLTILSLLSSSFAYGAELNAVQLDKSSIAFVSRQMNVPVEGAFRKFSAQINLDPARPEVGRARIEIDLASIDAGSNEANDEVKGKNWFNTREFPLASFVSSAVKALGGGRFEAVGKMTIKGKTLESHAPFTLKQEKGVLILDGAFPLKRLDYGIGSGVWSDTSVVADEVLVKFHFILTVIANGRP
jgi:polyisoprenoid-binding protein YceI